MLYLIYGNDWEKGRAKAREILDTLKKKKPDAVVVSLEEGGVGEAKIEELAGSQGLFERKFIVFSDRVCANLGNAEIIKIKNADDRRNQRMFLCFWKTL
jgi:DNA polymerase III delta subunit